MKLHTRISSPLFKKSEEDEKDFTMVEIKVNHTFQEYDVNRMKFCSHHLWAKNLIQRI